MTDSTTGEANEAQIEYWNSASGEKWIRYEERLDGGLSSVKNRLLQRAGIVAGERVLEIGCGTGDTTMALAEAAGPDGAVLAVDVSEPLLKRAVDRAAHNGFGNISFLLADAQTHAFAPGSADVLASRFGVMFFADPAAAFANMAKALRPGGRVAFVSWAELDKNPWFLIPRDIAVARLGEPEPASMDAPGPLAFHDLERVTGILESAGFSEIAADEESIDLSFPGTIAEAADLASNLGMATRIVREKDGTPEDVAAIAEAVAAEIGDMAFDGGVAIPARLNFFNAIKA